MAVTFHFKDGNSATFASATDVAAFPDDSFLVAVEGTVRQAIVPVINLEYATIG